MYMQVSSFTYCMPCYFLRRSHDARGGYFLSLSHDCRTAQGRPVCCISQCTRNRLSLCLSSIFSEFSKQHSSRNFPDDGQTNMGHRDTHKHQHERHTKGRHKPHQVLNSGQILIFVQYHHIQMTQLQLTSRQQYAAHKTQRKQYYSTCLTHK